MDERHNTPESGRGFTGKTDEQGQVSGQGGMRERVKGAMSQVEERLTETNGKIGKSIAGKVQAESVSVKGVCAVATANEAEMKGASAVLITREHSDFTGGAGVMVTGGDLELHAGGAPVIVTRGKTTIEKGGGAMIVTRKAKLAQGGYAGIVLARKVKVADGGKVLITPLPAILLGAVFGGVFALVASMLGGRSSGRRGMLHGGNVLGSARREAQSLYARGARADAMRHGRAAMHDMRSAAHHVSRAGREVVTGRF
jgi:hypothetical protein